MFDVLGVVVKPVVDVVMPVADVVVDVVPVVESCAIVDDVLISTGSIGPFDLEALSEVPG